MKTKTLLIIFLLVIVSFSCNKKDDPNNDLITGDIKQPANYDAPAVLPAIKTDMKKLEGNFSPLLTGFIADWKIVSRYYFTSTVNDCWGGWETDYYNAVTRSQIKGKKLEYENCNWVGANSKPTPDFSDAETSPWGQYKEGADWIQDGGTHQVVSNIQFKRYYKTTLDLPDAYILKETKWETVKIMGQDYYISEGYPEATKTTSTTTGLSKAETKEWGYTLGIEFNMGVSVDVFEAGATVSASFNQQFSTSIINDTLKEESIALLGRLPAGKNIIRLQAFREVSTFKLVNKDGGAYFTGVYSPEIAVTTKIVDVAWYY